MTIYQVYVRFGVTHFDECYTIEEAISYNQCGEEYGELSSRGVIDTKTKTIYLSDFNAINNLLKLAEREKQLDVSGYTIMKYPMLKETINGGISSLDEKNIDVIHNLEDILKEMAAAKLYYESIVYAAYRYPWGDYPEDIGSTPKQRFRDMAEQNLREAGYLSPYKRKSWRITEDRKLALDQAVRFMSWANNAVNGSNFSMSPKENISKDLRILKSMLEESGGEDGIQQ